MEQEAVAYMKTLLKMKGGIFPCNSRRLLKIYLILLRKLEGFHIGSEFHPQGLLRTKGL